VTNKKDKNLEPQGMPLVLRKKQVLAMVGLSASTVYALQKSGAFPQPLRLSLRAMGWLSSDIERWLADKAAARAA
jgi:prophage regulatory protein